MTVEMLLVTNDVEVMNTIRPALELMGVQLQLRAEPRTAREICLRRRFDGVVVDLVDPTAGAELLAEIRGSRSNKLATILAVVNRSQDQQKVLNLGANP